MIKAIGSVDATHVLIFVVVKDFGFVDDRNRVAGFVTNRDATASRNRAGFFFRDRERKRDRPRVTLATTLDALFVEHLVPFGLAHRSFEGGERPIRNAMHSGKIGGRDDCRGERRRFLQERIPIRNRDNAVNRGVESAVDRNILNC